MPRTTYWDFESPSQGKKGTTLTGYLEGRFSNPWAPSTIYIASLKNYPDFIKIGFCQVRNRQKRFSDSEFGEILFDLCEEKELLSGDIPRAEAYICEKYLFSILMHEKEFEQINDLRKKNWSGYTETFKVPDKAKFIERVRSKIKNTLLNGDKGWEIMLDQIVILDKDKSLYLKRKNLSPTNINNEQLSDAYLETEKSFTVGELNHSIGAIVSRKFASNFKLKATVCKSESKQGHLWLTLTDGKATLDGIVWSTSIKSLNFLPKKDDKVIIFGKLNFWETQARISIQILEIISTDLTDNALNSEDILEAENDNIKKTVEEETKATSQDNLNDLGFVKDNNHIEIGNEEETKELEENNQSSQIEDKKTKPIGIEIDNSININAKAIKTSEDGNNIKISFEEAKEKLQKSSKAGRLIMKEKDSWEIEFFAENENVQEEKISINKIKADEINESDSEYINKKGYDQFSLPELNKELSKKLQLRETILRSNINLKTRQRSLNSLANFNGNDDLDYDLDNLIDEGKKELNRINHIIEKINEQISVSEKQGKINNNSNSQYLSTEQNQNIHFQRKPPKVTIGKIDNIKDTTQKSDVNNVINKDKNKKHNIENDSIDWLLRKEDLIKSQFHKYTALQVYHPTKSELHDSNDKRILAFKDHYKDDHYQALCFYSIAFKMVIPRNTEILLTCAPGSKAYGDGSLNKLIKILSGGPIKDGSNLLKTIRDRGKKSLQHKYTNAELYETIEINKIEISANCRILILDDVITSGQTFNVCKKILIDSGYKNQITCLGIGKTDWTSSQKTLTDEININNFHDPLSPINIIPKNINKDEPLIPNKIKDSVKEVARRIFDFFK